MIYLCEAMMGVGKTVAMCRHINEHPDNNYLYITASQDERANIVSLCGKYDGKNILNTSRDPEDDILRGKSIVIALDDLPRMPNLITVLEAYNYVVILDEAVQVLDEVVAEPGDLSVLQDAGLAKLDSHGGYVRTDKEYGGVAVRDILDELTFSPYYEVRDVKNRFMRWKVPPALFGSELTVYVLVFDYEASELFTEHQLYGNIYISTRLHIDYDELGDPFFSEDATIRQPNYISYDPSLFMNVLDRRSLDKHYLGDSDLSMTWYRSSKGYRESIDKTTTYYFRDLFKSSSVKLKMLGMYPDVAKLPGGHTHKSYAVPYDERGTSAHRERCVLMYPVNVFYSPAKLSFYKQLGLEFDEDRYALNTMLHWIWLSAIRDGYKVDLFVPSYRMRKLLYKWLNDVTRVLKERK